MASVISVETYPGAMAGSIQPSPPAHRSRPRSLPAVALPVSYRRLLLCRWLFGRGRLLTGGVLGRLQPALEPVLLRLHRLAHELFPGFAARPLTLVLGALAGELLPGVHLSLIHI